MLVPVSEASKSGLFLELDIEELGPLSVSPVYNSNHTTITHFTVTILSEQRQFSFRRSSLEEIPGLVAIDKLSVIS